MTGRRNTTAHSAGHSVVRVACYAGLHLILNCWMLALSLDRLLDYFATLVLPRAPQVPAPNPWAFGAWFILAFPCGYLILFPGFTRGIGYWAVQAGNSLFWGVAIYHWKDSD